MNCRWCGGQDHSRVSSKKCKKYSKWKELKTAEAKQVFHKSQCVPSQIAIAKRKNLQKKRDARRKDTTKRKLSRKKAEKTRKDTKKRKLSRQQAEKTRKDTPNRKLSRQQAEKTRKDTPKRKRSKQDVDKNRQNTPVRKKSRNTFEADNDRRKSVYRYKLGASDINITDIFRNNHHKFAKYASANVANKGAGYILENEEDVLKNLKIITDAELLKVHKRWVEHCKSGTNRDVCATCGIVGLVSPHEFSIKEKAIAAFKVKTVFEFILRRKFN